MKVESTPIQATTRKLKARWNFEMSQDLEAYYRLDSSNAFKLKKAGLKLKYRTQNPCDEIML